MTPGKLRIPPTTPNDFTFLKETPHNHNIMSENITKKSSHINTPAKNNVNDFNIENNNYTQQQR